jgi:sensor histidine kinase regulating citrate/malate metabolism
MHPQMSGASMIEVDDLASAPGEITAAQWRQIVNGATDTAIISTDQRGIVSSWNSGAGCILGWSEPEMPASHWAASLPMATGKRG